MTIKPEVLCICGDDGGIHPDFYIVNYPKAIKTHTCCECNESIQPGEQYECVNAKWEDEVASLKTCSTCVKIRHEFFSCGPSHGFMWEEIHEEICCGYSLPSDQRDDYFCICPEGVRKKWSLT